MKKWLCITFWLSCIACAHAVNLNDLDVDLEKHHVGISHLWHPYPKNRIEMRKASKADWNVREYPSKYEEIELDLTLSQKEFEYLQLGIVPDYMEHRWFAYFQDGHLIIHRSWSGFMVFDVFLVDGASNCKAVKVRLNRDPSQCTITRSEAVHHLLNLMNFLTSAPKNAKSVGPAQ